jgi:hypothetical protein
MLQFPKQFSEVDLTAIKSALLYADQVKLFSSAHAILLGVLKLNEHIEREQGFVDKEIKELVNQFSQESGTEDLIPLMQQRVIEVHRYSYWNDDEILQALARNDTSDLNLDRETAQEKTVESFERDLVNYLLNNPTVPLLDHYANNLLYQPTGDKISIPNHSAHSKHIALAFNIFTKLPVFELASISEIMDIRRELEHPLIRFRSAMIEFSDTIKHEPWNESFVTEAEVVFYREIAPTILEIEERVKTNRYLTELACKATDKAIALTAGSAVTIAISQISSLPHLVSYAAILSGVTGLSSIAYQAYHEWQTKQQEINQNNLLFLYEAQKRLSKKRKTKYN